MAGAKVKNLAWGELAIAVTASSTALVLSGNQGARFPVLLNNEEYFYVTLFDAEGNNEVCRCFARDTNTLNVVRGVDGTDAHAWSAGTKVRLQINAALLDDKVSQEDFTKTVNSINATIRELDDATYKKAGGAINTNLSVGGDTTLAKSLTVTGASVLNGGTTTSNLTVTGTGTIQNLVVPGTSTLKGAVDCQNTLTVSSTTNINGALNAKAGVTVTGAISASTNISASGSISASGNITSSGYVYGRVIQSTSDIRMKDNLELLPTKEALEMVDKIHIYTFNWKDKIDDRSIGVVAQEVEHIVPDAVKPRKEYLTVNYQALTSVLFAAVQELHKEIEEMKKCQKRF